MKDDIDDIEKTVEHFTNPPMRGAHSSVTYKFKNAQGLGLYVIVTVDEFSVIKGIFMGIESSGTTLHNVVNCLGRILSLAIQEIRQKDPNQLIPFLMKAVSNMQGISSDTVWMNDSLGRANSIPEIIALILLRQVEIDERMDENHSGEEE